MKTTNLSDNTHREIATLMNQIQVLTDLLIDPAISQDKTISGDSEKTSC